LAAPVKKGGAGAPAADGTPAAEASTAETPAPAAEKKE